MGETATEDGSLVMSVSDLNISQVACRRPNRPYRLESSRLALLGLDRGVSRARHRPICGTRTLYGLPVEVVRRPQVEGLGSRPTSSCGAIRRQSSASPDLQNEFVGAVIGAMDSSADLSTQILNNPDLSQKLLSEFVPSSARALKAAG